jgi:hypothetical protein
MATNDNDISVYAKDMQVIAERIHTHVACMVDAIGNDATGLASCFIAMVREDMDQIASSANRMSNDYLDDFGKCVNKCFANYQKMEG